MSLSDEIIELSDASTRDNEDLKNRFERLKLVEVRCNTPHHKIKEEDRTPVILSRSPEACQVVLTAEHRAKGVSVTTEDMEDAMNQHYGLLRKGETDQIGDEIALAAFDGKC